MIMFSIVRNELIIVIFVLSFLFIYLFFIFEMMTMMIVVGQFLVKTFYMQIFSILQSQK